MCQKLFSIPLSYWMPSIFFPTKFVIFYPIFSNISSFTLTLVGLLTFALLEVRERPTIVLINLYRQPIFLPFPVLFLLSSKQKGQGALVDTSIHDVFNCA